MEPQDSSAPPSHHLHHHHHHHPHPPPSSAVFVNPHQHPLPNNSYPLPNTTTTNNSVIPSNSNATMMQQQQNPHFLFNSMPPQAVPKPLEHHFSDELPPGGGGFSVEPARKKRGRPRKYSPDNSIGLGLSPVTPGAQISAAMVVHNDSSGGGGGGGTSATPSSDTAGKRNRGRPPGSGKKQLDALGLPGVGFTPHVITVNKGEDIASKIMAFSQEGPRTVCILSANGAVSNVTLRQAATSGGTVTYEGRFEIISLSGSFMLVESNGNRSRTGALSVSLAGSDGRVLGGGVAGMLKAATPVQVIVGSFIAEGKKPKSSRLSFTPRTNTNMLDFGAPVIKTDPSPDASSESADDNDDSPLNHGSGPYTTNSGQPIQNMTPMYSTMGWPNSMKMQ